MIQYIGSSSIANKKLQDIVFDAKEQGDYAKEQGDAAKEAANNANEAVQSANQAAENANNAATTASNAANNANTQATYAKSIADQNKTNWLTPVSSFADISTTYPNPKLGDTVQTIDDSKIYRFDGTQWVWTQQYSDTAMTDVVNKMGDLSNLDTIDNSSVVNAINEVNQKFEFYDTDIEITHNLNDYPLAHVVAEELYGFGGYGEYGIGNKYQLLNKAEYIDTSTLRIHLFLSNSFSGSPIVNKITDLEYRITFTGQDGYLTVYLIPMTTTV